MEFDYHDQHGKPLVTIPQAAAIMDVHVETVRHWTTRGYRERVGTDLKGRPVFERRTLQPAGLDRYNRPLFRVADVADAEKAVRGRGAPRMVAA